MGRPSKSERLRSIHYDAMVEFDGIQSAMRDERKQCLDDRRFVDIAGAQWEGSIGDQFENKPRLEVNKCAESRDAIIREYRNNRIDASFTSKDGSTDDSLSDTCAMLYRSDEQDSSAEEAYDNGFDEMVSGGFGAWRLRACYEDEENGGEGDDEDQRQRIQIEPIFDADSSVFFDLDAKRQDKSDARSCYVITSMTRKEYERKYKDDPASWEKLVHQYEFDWSPPDVVYIAEYYVVERKSEVQHCFRGLGGDEVYHTDEELDDSEEESEDGSAEDQVPVEGAEPEGNGAQATDEQVATPEESPEPGLRRILKATGYQEVSQKTIKRKTVHKYLLNGNAVLKDCGRIAGSEIPVIPVYGKRRFIENIERCEGHIRRAKDSQKVKNMQISRLAEMSALSSVEKPIFLPEQINNHAVMWAEDNIVNRPYLVVDPITDAAGQSVPSGPVGYTKVSNVPPTMAALLQLTDTDMKEILGNVDQTEKMVSHVAGKTVEMIQMKIDARAMLFISNMGKAIVRSAQVWLSMARELYTEPGRKMKGVDSRKARSQIELQKPMIGPDGRVMKANDLTRAKFDVHVDIGPSSDSKRAAAVRSGTNLLPLIQDQQLQTLLANFVIANMEGEGVEDLRASARMQLIRMGGAKPTEEEQKQLQLEAQNAKPSPNDEYLHSAAAAAQAKAQESAANTALKVVQGEKVKADTQKVLADIGLNEKKAGLDTIKTLSDADMAHHKAAVETHKSFADVDLSHQKHRLDTHKTISDIGLAHKKSQLDAATVATKTAPGQPASPTGRPGSDK